LGISAFIRVYRRFQRTFIITFGRTLLAVMRTLAATVLLHAAVVHADDDPLANGLLLVAKPELADPNFRETVVLITQPVPGGGPLGVILNRPLPARLSAAMPGIGSVPQEFDQLYGGGPVSRNRLIFLVRTRDRSANGLRVLDDVYLSGDPAWLKQIVSGEVTVGAFRAYGGYAGWAPRQLQAEITAGGWYLLPADADTIFSADAATMWPELMKRISRRSTRFVPLDPIIPRPPGIGTHLQETPSPARGKGAVESRCADTYALREGPRGENGNSRAMARAV
jgi:putative transcriptional regulator